MNQVDRRVGSRWRAAEGSPGPQALEEEPGARRRHRSWNLERDLWLHTNLESSGTLSWQAALEIRSSVCMNKHRLELSS